MNKTVEKIKNESKNGKTKDVRLVNKLLVTKEVLEYFGEENVIIEDQNNGWWKITTKKPKERRPIYMTKMCGPTSQNKK